MKELTLKRGLVSINIVEKPWVALVLYKIIPKNKSTNIRSVGEPFLPSFFLGKTMKKNSKQREFY